MTFDRARGNRWTAAAALLVASMFLASAPVADFGAAQVPLPATPVDCAASDDAQDPVELSPPVQCIGSLDGTNGVDRYEVRMQVPPNSDTGARVKMVISATPAAPGFDLGLCVKFASWNQPCSSTAPNAPEAIIELEAFTLVEFAVYRIAGEGPYALSVVTDGWTSTMSCATPPVVSTDLPPGTFATDVQAVYAGPPNDCFADATDVTAPLTHEFHTVSATLEPGERACDGYDYGGSRSVWFRFTPKQSANYYAYVDNGATFGNGKVAVYTGTAIHDLSQVACMNWNGFVGAAGRAEWYGEAGTTYHVQVATSDERTFRLFLNGGSEDLCEAPPANNCYEDAAIVTSPSVTHWTLDGAILQPGEWQASSWADLPIEGSLWFEFTPEARARYDIGMLGERYTGFTLYEVHGPDGLGQVRLLDHIPSWAGEGTGSGPDADMWYTLQAGTTYKIRAAEHYVPNAFVGSVGVNNSVLGSFEADPIGFYHPALEAEPRGYAMGNLDLTITGGGVPCGVIANDCFADAQPIVLSSQTKGTNLNAGIETVEPLTCWNSISGNYASVWYRYDSLEDGRVMADLIGSDFSFFIRAFKGTELGALEPVSLNENWLTSCTDVHDGQYGTAGFEWDASAGETYWIQISGRPAWEYLEPPESGPKTFLPADGNITLNLHRANGECSPGVPLNDCIADATPLATGETLSGSNVGGRAQGNERFPCNMGLETVWYHVDAGAGGSMTVDTFGSDFDTVLAVYEADKWRDTQLACNNNAAGTPQSEVTWTAQAGKAYLVQAGGHDGATGNLTISLS